MIQPRKAVAAWGLAVALLLCPGMRVQASSAADAAAVHAADDAWVKAYNAGQVESVIALYDESAVVYPPGAPPLHGKAEIHAYFEKDIADFARTGLAFALGDKPSGGVSGDMGWSSGTWTLKDKTGQIVDSGWYFSVSRKAGGKWLYVRDTWNSDKPAEPAAGGNDR